MIGYTILSIKTMMLYHHVTIDCIQGTFHEYLAISFRGFMQQKTSMYGCIYIYILIIGIQMGRKLLNP